MSKKNYEPLIIPGDDGEEHTAYPCSVCEETGMTGGSPCTICEGKGFLTRSGEPFVQPTSE